MTTRISRNNSMATTANNNNTTPMSIVITPAGQPPMQQTRLHPGSSATYQYPNDYDDDDYFTFPNSNNINDDENSMTLQTISKKPKALDILGVNEYDENNNNNSKIKGLNNLKIEPIHVPTDSAGENNNESKPPRSQSARISVSYKK